MSVNNSNPDLTQHAPRSPRLRLGGYALLPRIIDKGRASLTGKLGAYHYRGVGMDRHFFRFVGLDHESLKQELAKGGGDGEVLAWVQENAEFKRGPWEILAWSEWITKRTPDSDAETISEFAEMVAKLSKTREDIYTWFDFLDLDVLLWRQSITWSSPHQLKEEENYECKHQQEAGGHCHRRLKRHGIGHNPSAS